MLVITTVGNAMLTWQGSCLNLHEGAGMIPLPLQIVEAGLRLVDADLSDGISGNVSVRCSDGTVLMTPSSLDFRLLTEHDLVTLDLRSGEVHGRRRPSSEWRLHALVYEKRTDVNAVVHHHGAWSTAAAVARITIPVVVDEAADLGPVATAPYAPSASEELAQIVSDELRTGRNAVLLANHGVVVVGHSLRETVRRALQVERSAKIYIGAVALGGVHTLDAAAVASSQKFFEGYRNRPEADEFSALSYDPASHVRLLDLVNYSFRAGLTFASLLQTLIVQKLHHRSTPTAGGPT